MQIDAPNRDFPRRCEKQGGMAQSVARYCYHIVPPNQSHHFIVQIFAKLHSNPIWQKKNRFCFDIADKTPLRVCHRSALPHTDSQLCVKRRDVLFRFIPANNPLADKFYSPGSS